MASIILIIFFSFLVGDIISQNNWVIQNANSFICFNNETDLNFYIVSMNGSNMMIRKEDAFGDEYIKIYDFENTIEDMDMNLIVLGDYPNDIILFYGEYLQIINDKSEINKKYNIEAGFFRTTLKKVDSSFIYISSNFNLINININITTSKDNNKNYDVKVESIKIFDEPVNINFISCDISKDLRYYICSYFSGDNIEILLFSQELSLLSKLNINTDVKEPKNYFNKILFLKDNYKIISINSKNDTDIRLQYLEIKDAKLNIIKLNQEKNKEVEYLNIKGTQLNSSYLYNDIVVLDDDEIFKVYMKDNVFLLSKIQFYSNNTILTVKTKSYENMVDKSSHLHVTKRNNGIVIGFCKENSINFIQIGNIKTSVNKVIKNGNFEINNLEVQSILQTKLFAQIESVPFDYLFLRIWESTFLNKGSIIYPEDEDYQIVRYKTSKNSGSIVYQTKLIYEFPSDSEFQIFPKDETNIPPETKIISLGNKGKISFEIETCNNNYYEIENTDMCSLSRPEGYYFNRINKIFYKCHDYCSECITYSNDDSNMQCLKCKSGYVYDENTFNCAKIITYLPETIDIEISENEFFYVFLAITIIAIILAFLIFFQDIIFGKYKTKDSKEIEEIEEKDKTIELNQVVNNSNEGSNLDNTHSIDNTDIIHTNN